MAARARITVLTAGQLATCPRMLKAADALDEAGYRVRVVSARFMDWAAAADRELRAERAWSWSEVDYHPATGRAAWLRSGARHRAARAAAGLLGAARTPRWLAARAFSRAHDELLKEALAAPADLFYGGTTGALAATAAAGRRQGVPYGLDLEDFHRAEHHDHGPGRLANRLAARLEDGADGVLSGAAFLTAASAEIARAYREQAGVAPIPIHNVFPLPAALPEGDPAAVEDAAPEQLPSQDPPPYPPAKGDPPAHREEGRPGQRPGPPDLAGGPSAPAGLRLYWFSQTVGPDRGLEDVVRAMGAAGLGGELHLRGRAIGPYLESLRRLGESTAPALRLVHHGPAPPAAMVDLCRGFSAGLAPEQPGAWNRTVALGNKALTYILAGLPVVITGLPGHEELIRDLGEGALVYPPGHIASLAAGLRRWSERPETLRRARAAAWRAASRRWHWEHPLERGALLAAVAEALERR